MPSINKEPVARGHDTVVDGSYIMGMVDEAVEMGFDNYFTYVI